MKRLFGEWNGYFISFPFVADSDPDRPCIVCGGWVKLVIFPDTMDGACHEGSKVAESQTA